MADYAVSTAFTSKDGITPTFKKMGAAANKFGAKSSAAFKRANRSGLTFKSTLGAILSAQTISRGVGLLNQGIRSIGEEFVTFDDALTQAGAKFPVTVKKGTAEFARLEATARAVGATTKFSATEAAAGLDFLAMAGFDANQAMAALPKVTDLAVVANMDLARATDIASDALGAFGLMTKDATQLSTNLSRVNDVFAKTVTSANVDMEMLFETMKDGGPVMTAAGASIETFAALTGKMGSAGIKGSKAGTVLKNMFTRLQAPPTEAAKALKKLRIDAVDPTTGSMRDIIDILGEFNSKTAKMGAAQKTAYVNAIFGQRAIAGVNVLLGEGADSLREYRTTLEESNGASKDMAATIGESLGNRLKTLKSAAIEAGFKFIDAFKDKIPNAIDRAVEAVRQFDVGAVVDTISDIVFWFKEIKKIITKIYPVIVSLTAAYVAYNAIQKAIIAVQAIQYFIQMTAALRGAAAAQSLVNVAMTANPIGVVVAAVGLLIAAGWMLYKQWDNIKLLWNFFIEDTKDGLRKLSAWFTETWNRITNFSAQAVETMKEKFEGLKTSIIETWEGVATFFDDLWTRIKNTFFETIQNMVSGFGAIGGKIAGLFGFAAPPAGAPAGAGARAAGAGAPGPGREAPNREDVAAQNIRFQGKLTVAGAPPGSTLESTTRGAPPVKTELAGANI